MPPPYRLRFEMVGLSRPRDAVTGSLREQEIIILFFFLLERSSILLPEASSEALFYMSAEN